VADLEHRFDWYQATVPAHHELIVRELLTAMGEGSERETGKGMYSYLASSTIRRDGEVRAKVLHGGANPHPNVTSTGEFGHALAGWLRGAFPDHRVTRADACIDMRGEGLFDEISAAMSIIGREHRLKGERIVPDNPDDGATYYLGSRASPVRIRQYEKGKQLYKLTGDPVWKNFFDWTRLELQMRPEKDFKSVAARLEPVEFWGCSAWTRDLSRTVLAMNPEPVLMKPARISDHDRALRFLFQQYGATMGREIDKNGFLSFMQRIADETGRAFEGFPGV
jgi:hypothetical protein